MPPRKPHDEPTVIPTIIFRTPAPMTTSATLASLLTRTLIVAAVGGSALLTACGGGTAATTASVAAAAASAPTVATQAVAAADATATKASADVAVDTMQAAAVVPGVAGTAVLTWKGVSGSPAYRIYYGTSSRAYLQSLGSGVQTTSTSITLSGLTSGQTYYFSVTAIDSTGKETAYSDEMVKLVS